MEEPEGRQQRNPIGKVYLLIPDELGLSSSDQRAFGKRDEQEMMAVAAAAVFSATTVGVIAMKTPTAGRSVTGASPSSTPTRVVTVPPTNAAPSRASTQASTPASTQASTPASTQAPAPASGTPQTRVDALPPSGTRTTEATPKKAPTSPGETATFRTEELAGDPVPGSVVFKGVDEGPPDVAPELRGLLHNEKNDKGIQAFKVTAWNNIEKPNPDEDILVVASKEALPPFVLKRNPRIGTVFRHGDTVYEITDINPAGQVTARGYSGSRLFSARLKKFPGSAIDTPDWKNFQARQGILSRFQTELDSVGLKKLFRERRIEFKTEDGGTVTATVAQKKLGSGAFGEVYSIEFKTDTGNFQVAMKRTDAKANQGPEDFLSELNALQTMNGHPNFLKFYGGRYTQNDDLILFMEQAQPFDKASLKFDQVKQVWSGLEALHSQGLVHNDIKPANLGIGENGEIKFLDMGSAGVTPRDIFQSSENITITPDWALPDRTALILDGRNSGRYLIFEEDGVLRSAPTIGESRAIEEDGKWQLISADSEKKPITKHFGLFDPQQADKYSLALTIGHQIASKRAGRIGKLDQPFVQPSAEEIATVYRELADSAEIEKMLVPQGGRVFQSAPTQEELMKLLNAYENMSKRPIEMAAILRDHKILHPEVTNQQLQDSLDFLITHRNAYASKTDLRGRDMRARLKELRKLRKCDPLCKDTLERLSRTKYVLEDGSYVGRPVP